MKARPVLIATWGKPDSWVMAEYSVGSGPGIAAFSSTEALARALDAEWTLVLGLDTLFKQEASGKPSSYDEVVSRSRAYLEGYKCGLDASIEVLPGVINDARGKVRVTGNPQDFYMLAFHTLVKRILAVRSVLPPVVALDITHGINFMPNLAMTASLNAAAYLSLARALRGQNAARLEVYNSDPIIPSPGDPCRRGNDLCKPGRKPGRECKPTALTIHRVVKQRAGAPEIISAVDKLTWSLAKSDKRILKQRVGDEQLIDKVKNFNNGARDTLRDAFLLVKAFRLGLAPELIHMTRRLPGLRERIASTIEEALDLWAGDIKVREDSGWTVVERRIFLDYGFELLVHALALAWALAPLEELGPTMRAAMRLRDAYDKIGARITQTVQQREIEKINNAFKKKGCYGRILLRDLLDVPETRTDTPQELEGCQRFARDLVAHGGWHSDVVVLTRCDGEFGDVLIELREGDPVCRENGGNAIKIWDVIEKKY